MNKFNLLIVASLFIFAACSDETTKNQHQHGSETQKKVESYYTCSMHPQVKEHEPGKCPICHMNLTKVEVDHDEDEAPKMAAMAKPEKDIWYCKEFPDVTSDKEDVCPLDGTPMLLKKKESQAQKVVGKVKLRKAQLGHFSPEYFPVESMKMSKKIRLLGTVLQSEEKESQIPARVNGRVEKVYVKSTGSFINLGDPVVDLYAPKLITAGEEYLLARKSYQKNKSKSYRDLMNQAQERLELWGIQPKQYQAWYKNGKIPRQITIYSQATGIVRKRNATVGRYFKEGQNFFELSDLSDVWVEMDVYEQDAAAVKLGQKLSMEFVAIPGEKVEGMVDFINPVLDIRSRTLKIRTTIKNPAGKLKPGMAASVQLLMNFEGKPLVIPRSAIIDTGKRKVVWVKVTDKQFQAKTIMTGIESEGFVEVKAGLMKGELVVIEGNFLLDAQAQLFGGYEDMAKTDAHAGH